jgi:hypothetical protein
MTGLEIIKESLSLKSHISLLKHIHFIAQCIQILLSSILQQAYNYIIIETRKH